MDTSNIPVKYVACICDVINVFSPLVCVVSWQDFIKPPRTQTQIGESVLTVVIKRLAPPLSTPPGSCVQQRAKGSSFNMMTLLYSNIWTFHAQV